MNKIIYDIELFPIQQNEDTYSYYRNYTDQMKGITDKIKFNLYCVKYCFEFNDEELKPYAQKWIELVESWLINPNSITKQNLNSVSHDVYNISYTSYAAICYASYAVSSFISVGDGNCYADAYNAWNLYYCSQIPNINMNLPHQYLKILLRTTKQFNINNLYSNHIKQITKQDIDKLELVDWNMLIDISNEHYNIDLSEFNYDNIFSRRNLIETIRREYQS